MIGAIVLAQNDQLTVRSQNIFREKQVKKNDIVKLKVIV